MAALSHREVIEAWELGAHREGPARTLAILGVALPGKSVREIAEIPLGRRDRLVLEIIEQTFGPTLECFTNCPACRQPLEFSVATGAIRGDPADDRELAFEFVSGDLRARLHSPNSFDLAAAGRAPDVRRARQVLLERCVLAAERRGESLEAGDLTPAEIQLLGDALSQRDPQVETSLQLHCAECRHYWVAALDVAAFLWTEIAASAKRLLREIAAVARAYGWSEAEILSMSGARRRYYLEMALA